MYKDVEDELIIKLSGSESSTLFHPNLIITF